MKLHNYDMVIINSSAGKDSLAAIFEVCRLAEKQNYPKANIVVSHQDLGEMEWRGTKDLVKKQADYFGLETYYSSVEASAPFGRARIMHGSPVYFGRSQKAKRTNRLKSAQKAKVKRRGR